MLFPCKYCGKSFCASHRLPEKHGCMGGVANPSAGPSQATFPSSSYVDQDLQLAQNLARQGAMSPQGVDRPREYVWEPKITELPDDPFNPASGVILRGVFWPKGKEIFHIMIAFALMFLIGILISQSFFSQFSTSNAQAIFPGYNVLEQTLFPFYLASMSTGGFLIHEFSHRQVGRRYKMPAKFRLLTFGMILTMIGIFLYLSPLHFPPFALPGAVVVIGLENKNQAGKCKAAGPISNFIIALILIPIAFVTAIYRFGFEYFMLFSLGAYMNAFLGMFNMLPVGLLDGHAILEYKKGLWVILFFSLVCLFVFELVVISNPLIWFCKFYPAPPGYTCI